MNKIKVAFYASDFIFLHPIIDILSRDAQFECRSFTGGDLNEALTLESWSDVSWIDWCDVNAVGLTQQPKLCKKIVIRLHSYEAFNEWPSKIEWKNVDRLIIVSEGTDRVLTSIHQNLLDWMRPENTKIIHNGLDFDKFQIPENKEFNKKIAYVGSINYKKGPAVLINLFEVIHSYDREFTLHIAGEFQDPRYEVYIRDFLLETKLPVFFNGHVEDIPNWLKDKTFVINTSLFESFCYGIAEAIACGLLPVCYRWHGFTDLYPSNWSFRTFDDAIKLLIYYENTMGGAVHAEINKPLIFPEVENLRRNNRLYLQKRYDIKDKVEEIKKLLLELV